MKKIAFVMAFILTFHFSLAGWANGDGLFREYENVDELRAVIRSMNLEIDDGMTEVMTATTVRMVAAEDRNEKNFAENSPGGMKLSVELAAAKAQEEDPEEETENTSSETIDGEKTPDKKDETPVPDKKDETLDPDKKDETLDPDKKDETLDPEKKDVILDPEKKDVILDPDKKDETPDPDKKDETLDPDKKEETLDPDKKEETPDPDKKDGTADPDKKDRTKNLDRKDETGLMKQEGVLNEFNMEKTGTGTKEEPQVSLGLSVSENDVSFVIENSESIEGLTLHVLIDGKAAPETIDWNSTYRMANGHTYAFVLQNGETVLCESELIDRTTRLKVMIQGEQASFSIENREMDKTYTVHVQSTENESNYSPEDFCFLTSGETYSFSLYREDETEPVSVSEAFTFWNPRLSVTMEKSEEDTVVAMVRVLDVQGLEENWRVAVTSDGIEETVRPDAQSGYTFSRKLTASAVLFVLYDGDNTALDGVRVWNTPDGTGHIRNEEVSREEEVTQEDTRVTLSVEDGNIRVRNASLLEEGWMICVSSGGNAEYFEGQETLPYEFAPNVKYTITLTDRDSNSIGLSRNHFQCNMLIMPTFTTKTDEEGNSVIEGRFSVSVEGGVPEGYAIEMEVNGVTIESKMYNYGFKYKWNAEDPEPVFVFRLCDENEEELASASYQRPLVRSALRKAAPAMLGNTNNGGASGQESEYSIAYQYRQDVNTIHFSLKAMKDGEIIDPLPDGWYYTVGSSTTELGKEVDLSNEGGSYVFHLHNGTGTVLCSRTVSLAAGALRNNAILPPEIDLTVTYENWKQGEWTNQDKPAVFHLKAQEKSPTGFTDYYLAYSVNQGPYIRLGENRTEATYRPDDGIYSVRFAVINAQTGDTIAAYPESFDIRQDSEPPLLTVTTVNGYGMIVGAMDFLSGPSMVSVNGGQSWSPLATQNDGSKKRGYQATQQVRVPAGQIQVSDAAGNITRYPADIQLYVKEHHSTNYPIVISPNPTQTPKPSSSPSARKYAKGSGRVISHASSDVDVIIAYNGVELKLDDTSMSQLSVGTEMLDLILRTGMIRFQENDQGYFKAEFASWLDQSVTDTLILTASRETDNTEYDWIFSGTVLRKLLNSGINHLVLQAGENVIALSTLGFIGGRIYDDMRIDGMVSKDFLYGIHMDSAGRSFDVEVTVNSRNYLLSSDTQSEFYYYGVYRGSLDPSFKLESRGVDQ